MSTSTIPTRLIYGRAAILDFMRSVLAEPKPTWQMFEQARLSKVSKDYTGDKRWRVLVPNPAWTGTSKSRSSSASRVSSRASSTTSLNVLEKRLPAGSSSMQVDDTVATAASASFPTSSSPLTLNTRLDPPSDYMSQMYCTLTRHFSIWKSSVFSKK
uniref:Uncharacterized protein n=1 Tax=Caenorhabditis japonica TaxID=281687 RepID=A0A8R1IZ37_CAEJA